MKYLDKSKKYKSFHYKQLSVDTFEYMHKRMIEMLQVIIDILNHNNIQYMICGGTLLGAVTTGKFIPWDDDVDICIFEDDYVRAMECLIAKMPKDMVLQCKKTEKNYYHGWVKVRDKNSCTYPGEMLYKENGIWIDIYKLVPMKAKEVDFRKTTEHVKYLKRRLCSGGINKEEYWKRLLDNKLVVKLIFSSIKKIISKDNKKVFYIQSASGITLNEEWCSSTKIYTFEGIKVTGFGNAEKYLIRHYGKEYDLLPKEDDRRISINRVDVYNNSDEKML